MGPMRWSERVHQESPAPPMTTESPPRKISGRWLVTPQAVLRVAIVSALFPMAGWFSGYHWSLDLFNHPQAQYFCFLLPCFITLAAWRKPKHALFCLALLMTLPIDHILTRGFSGTIRRMTGPALGSDHRPVIAALSW